MSQLLRRSNINIKELGVSQIHFHFIFLILWILHRYRKRFQIRHQLDTCLQDFFWSKGLNQLKANVQSLNGTFGVGFELLLILLVVNNVGLEDHAQEHPQVLASSQCGDQLCVQGKTSMFRNIQKNIGKDFENRNNQIHTFLVVLCDDCGYHWLDYVWYDLEADVVMTDYRRTHECENIHDVVEHLLWVNDRTMREKQQRLVVSLWILASSDTLNNQIDAESWFW